MTSITDTTQTCKDCEFFLRYDKIIGICRNEYQEHYQHVIHRAHPFCGILFDTIESMLAEHINQKHTLDNRVKV